MILFIADKADGGGAENQMLEELTILSKYFEILLLTKMQPQNETLLFLEQNNITFLGAIDNCVPVGLVRQFNISAIHAHNIWNLEMQSYIKALNIKPIVMTIHDYRILCPTGWKLQPNENVECMHRSKVFCQKSKCFENEHANNTNASLLWFDQYDWLKNYINGYAVVNKHLLRRMTEDNFQNLHNVPYPVSQKLKFYNNLRSKSICFIANVIAEHKGTERLIKTIQHLYKIDNTIKFYIIGSGNMLKTLEQLTINQDNIIYTGHISSEDTIKYIKNSAVVYIPSKWQENFPLVARSARMSGTPILVPKTSGFMQRLNKGMSEFYIPTETDNDGLQLKNMVDKVVLLQKGSTDDRDDEIEQSAVSIFLKKTFELYHSIGISFQLDNLT